MPHTNTRLRDECPVAPPATRSDHASRADRGAAKRSWVTGLVVGIFVLASSAGYEVLPGDTLAGIAARHDTTVAELADLNGLANPDLIRVGQVLEIPGQGGADGSTYTVAAGDTLGSIAARHGTSLRSLIDANRLPDPDLLPIGAILTIPVATAGPSSTTSVSPAATHIVAAGDTLASIARRYGTTVEAIAAANGITDASVIFVGTQLRVDGGGGAVPAPSAGGSTSVHVVREGESLSAIAGRFGTTTSALATANSLDDPNTIRIGQELAVPASGWVCPVEGARYFNDWGFPRSGGRFHQGNDLFAPRDTEVRAPVSGTVELRNGVVGGLQFWLSGDDGSTYIGTHLERFGQAGAVPAGAVIGYVGDSGNAKGSEPHVHFEILVGGSPVNPYPILQRNGC